MHNNKFLFAFVVIFLLAGCKDNLVDNTAGINYKGISLVKVQVDLQYGFAGKNVVIELNGEESFTITNNKESC
jgi:hypothetical protein